MSSNKRTLNNAITDLMLELASIYGQASAQIITPIAQSLHDSASKQDSVTIDKTPEKPTFDTVTINMVGEGQLEASRMIAGIVAVVLEKAHITDNKITRQRGDEHNPEKIKFLLSQNKTDNFIEELDKVTRIIKDDSKLKEQCRKGVEFSRDTLRHIPQIRAYVWLRVPDDEKQRPYFILGMQGVPESLADQLITAMGIKKLTQIVGQGFEDSPERKGIDGRRYSGGKNVPIPLSASTVDAAFAEIRKYAALLGRGGSPETGNRPRF